MKKILITTKNVELIKKDNVYSLVKGDKTLTTSENVAKVVNTLEKIKRVVACLKLIWRVSKMIDRIEYNELLDKIEKLENKKDYFVEEFEEELEKLKERLDRLEHE